MSSRSWPRKKFVEELDSAGRTEKFSSTPASEKNFRSPFRASGRRGTPLTGTRGACFPFRDTGRCTRGAQCPFDHSSPQAATKQATCNNASGVAPLSSSEPKLSDNVNTFKSKDFSDKRAVDVLFPNLSTAPSKIPTAKLYSRAISGCEQAAEEIIAESDRIWENWAPPSETSHNGISNLSSCNQVSERLHEMEPSRVIRRYFRARLRENRVRPLYNPEFNAYCNNPHTPLGFVHCNDEAFCKSPASEAPPIPS